jgi:hypothetical protein
VLAVYISCGKAGTATGQDAPGGLEKLVKAVVKKM